MKIINFLAFFSMLVLALMSHIAAENYINIWGDKALTENDSNAHDRRHSLWTKIANNMKASTLEMNRSHDNVTKLQKQFISGQIKDAELVTENISDAAFPSNKIKDESFGIFKELSPTREDNVENATALSSGLDNLETKIMNDKYFDGMKEFADRLINRTAKFLSDTNKNGGSRSYAADEQAHHQLWDDQDQSYQAPTFGTPEYVPTSFSHHYVSQPHYYPPQKKDDALLTKVGVLILIKLILAKLKAIGLLKLVFFFIMKVPILFFKFLFILKGFKLLKLVSLPFIIASFTVPLLPLILLFAPLLLAPIFFGPLLLPLLLPLLFFLPLIPITTPVTASGASTRKRRDVANDIDYLTNQAVVHDKWKNYNNETGQKLIMKRKRPSSYENMRKDLEDAYRHSGIYDSEKGEQDSVNLLMLAQRVAESQHCTERIACELAVQNDSKIYQAAIFWALEKVHKFAFPRVRRKIERYTEGYKTGAKSSSSDACRERFYCQKPKILLIQGKSEYKLF